MEARRGNSSEAKRAYARLCRKVSEKYGLNFELCLSLGIDEERYKRFLEKVNSAIEHGSPETEKALKYLRNDDIDCVQKCAGFIIGGRLYKELNLAKSDKNLQRVRAYILQQADCHTSNEQA